MSNAGDRNGVGADGRSNPGTELVAEVTARLEVAGGGRAPIIREISAMTPDASLRRYYRVRFERPVMLAGARSGTGDAIESVVAMVFDSVASPEAGGEVQVRADDAFVELGRFFSAQGVAVPQILLDARDRAVILIEDLGDRQLADFALTGKSELLERLLPEALQQIRAIQRIPAVPEFFPYRRSFTAAAYRREMEEFRDFIMVPRSAPAPALAAAEALFDQLATELAQLPKVLVHRDFHGWNLIVDPRGTLRVIDFQDALLATKSYDLVSLLNDRDMDQAIGEPLYRKTVVQFGALLVEDGAIGGMDEFFAEYDRVLLQRDLKVAGRFGKLVALRGLTHYGSWIPGTIRRIGRTIERLSARGGTLAALEQFFDQVAAVVPELRDGAATPLRF